MGYNRLVERALRGAVREALERVSAEGLPGAHHFYISFRTTDPGVQIPDFLRAKFPEEMTIVLQHQFWGLMVEQESFEVTLSFSRARQRLHVPFRALTGFFDPSVQFGLQFQQGETRDVQGITIDSSTGGPPLALPGQSDAKPARPRLPARRPAAEAPPTAASSPEPPAKPPADGGDKAVALDRFRKKQ